MTRGPAFSKLARTLVGAVLGVFVGLPSSSAGTLSIQGCNTRCQTEQTDCVLACDGDIPCIQACQQAADVCVERCVRPSADN